jgi:hypothetical protein
MKIVISAMALIFLAVPASANNWNDSDVFVEAVYHQTDSNGSFQDPIDPYAFRASARNTFTSQQQTLTLPASSTHVPNPVMDFVQQGAHHVFWRGRSTLADVQLDFPAGTYNWNITGGSLSDIETPSIGATADTPPAFQPQIINGTWSNGRLQLTASNPRFDITSWTSAPSGSRIELELWRDGGAGGSSMGSATTTVSWPAQPVGSVFSAYLSFRVIRNETQTASSFNTRSGQASTLYFEIEMVGDPEPNPGPTSDVPVLSIAPGIVLGWMSQVNQTYQIHTSIDLLSWSQLGANIPGTGGEIQFFASSFTSQKFYKLIVNPETSSSLVILEALYGADETFVDVQASVEANIVNDQVNMTVGNHTLGGDPLPGVTKALYIRYQNVSGEFEATISEGESLRIPDPSHTPL